MVLGTELHVVDPAIEAVTFQQLVVSPSLDNLAVLQHEDQISPSHGRQPVGDHKRRPTPDRLVQRLLEPVLSLHVHARSGVVENDYRRVEKNSPGDCEPLTLSAGERNAAFADPRVVPVGQSLDEVVKLGDLRRLYHIFHVHLVETVRYVVPDGRGEHEHVLHDDADVLPQRLESHVPGVVAVDGYVPLGGVVEPGKDVGYRALA